MKEYKVIEIPTSVGVRRIIQDTLNVYAEVNYQFKSIIFDEAWNVFIIIFEREKE